MTIRKTDEAELGAELLNETEREDWNRYGLGPRAGTAAADRDATTGVVGAVEASGNAGTKGGGRHLGDRLRSLAPGRTQALETPRRVDSPDELFLDYRGEADDKVRGPSGNPRSPRAVANLVTVSVVGAIGLVVLAMVVAASAIWPAPAATPTRTPAAVSDASGSIVPGALQTTRMAHTGVAINLPMMITIADREQPPDDGTAVYLTGPTGGIALDPGTGAFKHIYGGTAFAGGVRKAIVAGGLWVSSGPSDDLCGPSCWAGSATYLLDTSTGLVVKSLPQTYLVGVASDGIWVATGAKLERLDPFTGAPLASMPWSGAGEPRFACGSVWEFSASDTEATIAKLDSTTGKIVGQSKLDAGITDGPTYIEGQCWMMSGKAGVSAGNTKIVWLGIDGTTVKAFSYSGKSILTLDREFWEYSQDGKLQRFEAVSGIDIGVAYVLPVKPTYNDPKWLFAAAGTLWMIDGDKLYGFDVLTGTSRVNG